jgi:predicted dehydrogenase
MAFIGVGSRGTETLRRFLFQKGVEVVAICDVDTSYIRRNQATLARNGRPAAVAYTGEEDWKKVCERDDIDLVYTATPWFLHAPIAIYAMEQGKHVVTELPLAVTIEECWDIVNTAERTRRHCMLLEQTPYDWFDLATLNMAQQGLFGEIVHVEGAYIHDLRRYNFGDRSAGERPSYWNFWRLKENTARDGSLYPMHGLGPVAQILNLGRGDKMDYLVSMSSNQYNMTAFAKAKYGENSEQARREYKKGDINSTLIKTAKGRSMLIQHDVSSPRPYDRLHTVSGTKGFAKKYPVRQLAFDEESSRGARHAKALNREEMADKLKEYEYPFITEIREFAEKMGGHGGMDFIMEYRLIKCLQKGLPLDMDVYDGVSWSAVIPLSAFSIANGSYPVKIPDFTRGSWQKVQGFRHTLIQ